MTTVGKIRDARRGYGQVTWLYLLFALPFMLALPYFLNAQEQMLNDPSAMLASSEGDATKQLALLLLYCVGAIILAVQFPPRALANLGLPLLLLLALCVASTVWSVNPEGTLRRVVALLGTVAVGTLAGLSLDCVAFTRLQTHVVAIVLLGSLLIAAVEPSAGLDPEGRLRGVFFHKNYMGSFAAVALLTIGVRYTAGGGIGPKLLLGGLFLICILCLVLSQSAAPLPSLLGAVGAMGVAQAARKSDGRFRALLPFAIASASLLISAFALSEGGAVLGRSDDLSGRTEVWDFALSMIGQRPLLGYGYDVFWLGANAPAAPFWKATMNVVANAHNGYIQVALDLGLGGLGLLFAALITVTAKVSVLLRRCDDPFLLWVVGYVVFLSVLSFGEAAIWSGNGMYTLLLVYVAVRTNVEYARCGTSALAVTQEAGANPLKTDRRRFPQ